MTKRYTDKQLTVIFRDHTDEQLTRRWNECGLDRVKTGKWKGCVTRRAAHWGDVILAEQKRRRLAREAATDNLAVALLVDAIKHTEV